MTRVAGKRIVLTNSSSFMGPSIYEVFTEEGGEVVADDRDLAIPGAAEDLIREANHVDVLVANLAADNPKTSVTETTEGKWSEMFEMMVHPLFRLVRAVLPQMVDRRKGKIVVMGSASALRGMPNWCAYSAARGAQLAFVKAVGVEVAPYGINVNAVAQTFVENPSYFSPEYVQTDEFKERIKQAPVGRLAKGRESAQLALFLASEESNFFVGQIFPFSGGWVA
jgi:2-keto-3-deoxy-L-fuconate dehydrogenase